MVQIGLNRIVAMHHGLLRLNIYMWVGLPSSGSSLILNLIFLKTNVNELSDLKNQ